MWMIRMLQVAGTGDSQHQDAVSAPFLYTDFRPLPSYLSLGVFTPPPLGARHLMSLYPPYP